MRQALHNRGFADAWLTDQHRVVFGSALQNLNGPANFVVATNDRVELADAGAFGQVNAVFFEGFALAFGIGIAYRLPAAHGIDGCLQAFATQAMLFGQTPDITLVIGNGQQEQFTGDESVAPLDGLFFCTLQQLGQFRPHLNLVLPGHLWQATHCGFCRHQQTLNLHTRTQQQGFGPLILLEHGHQNVGWLYVGMVTAQGQ